MCKQKSRSIYLRNNDKIDRYELVYSRFPEAMINGFSYNQEFTMWVLEHLGGNVHVPTIKTLEHRVTDAEIIANEKRYSTMKYKHCRSLPRYITVIMIYDKSNRAIGGGSSVCAAIEVPDRKLGYRLAFERMKVLLSQDGYTIVPRVEAEKLLGV